MDMALHCDIRMAAKKKTRFIGHNAGKITKNGGSYYLPKMVGLGRALEFALHRAKSTPSGLINGAC